MIEYITVDDKRKHHTPQSGKEEQGEMHKHRWNKVTYCDRCELSSGKIVILTHWCKCGMIEYSEPPEQAKTRKKKQEQKV